MAMPDEATVLKRLQEHAEYPGLFQKAFPGASRPITYDHMAEAITSFERTLMSRDRFDDFLKGNNQALSAAELRGLKSFLENACTTCHNGPVVGATSYQKIGLVHPFPTKDAGRETVTKDESDRAKFKVPSLRNVALTGPYFHDGSIRTLNDVAKLMGWHQLGKEFSAGEIQDLTAFLQALSGKDRRAFTTGDSDK
jgi:cytochrome c peroxidase